MLLVKQTNTMPA